MKINRIHLVFGMLVLALLTQACKDPVTKAASSRGKFKVRNWLRYEFQQLKTFSYGNSQVKKGQHVIGYEPSWLVYDSAYLNYPFQLLSDLVVGEYDVNPNTGFPRNDSALNAFREKDIIEVASSINENLNVMMAITDYGDLGYRSKFLSEPAKKNLFNSLDAILSEMNERRGGPEEREKVGLLVDFPAVPWSQRYDFADFLARIKKDLDNREIGKSCLLYLVLPPQPDQFVLYKDSIFASRVRDVVDLFVVRAHSFDVPICADARGPMMPLERPDELMDLDSLVNHYTKKARIPRNKLIVEVPYYSTVWSTDSTMSGRRPLVPLNEVFNTVVTPRLLDTLSLSFKMKMDTTSYYFLDTLSLNIAYEWVVRKKLGGIGIYGLGYGEGIDNALVAENMWQVVANNFAEPAPRLLFPGVAFILCFLMAGIMTSAVVHWQVRYALRDKRGKFWYYIALLSCILLAIVLCSLPLEVVPILWKLISLCILLAFPLGRKALKFFFMAAR